MGVVLSIHTAPCQPGIFIKAITKLAGQETSLLISQSKGSGTPVMLSASWTSNWRRILHDRDPTPAVPHLAGRVLSVAGLQQK